MLLWEYKRLIEPPNLTPFKGYILKVEAPIIAGSGEYYDYEGRFYKVFQGLPIGFKGRIIFLSRSVDLMSEIQPKNFLMQRQLEFLQGIGATKLGYYWVVEGSPDDARTTYSALKSAGLNVEFAKEELYRDLSYFFGGTPEEPFFDIMEEKDYGMRIGKDKFALVYSMTKVPTRVLPFHLYELLSTQEENFFCVVGFKKMSPEEAQMEFGKRLKLFEFQATEGKDLAKAEIAKEIVEQVRDINLGREIVIAFSSFVAFFGEDEKSLLKRRQSIEFALSQKELTFECENTTHAEHFSLLFSYNEKELRSLGLVRFMPQSRFYLFTLPRGYPRGKKEGAVFYNEVGEPFFLDIRVPPPNGLVVGQMGSGKSVFLQYFASFQDYVVFVEKIQEGEGSYTVFTKMLDGGYYPISLDRPVSINPFGNTIKTVDAIGFIEDMGYRFEDFTENDLNLLENVLNTYFFGLKGEVKVGDVLEKLRSFPGSEYLYSKFKDFRHRFWEIRYDVDRDKLLFLKTLLVMAYKLGAEINIDPALVEEVILKTYDRLAEDGIKVSREVLMSDFYQTARELKYTSLAQRLRSYTMEGAYGNFFDRPCSIEFKSHVFFELRTTDRELMPLVLLSILTWMVKWFSRPEMQDKTKGIILDEAWVILEDPSLVKFVEEAFRTYRKKGIFIMIASQFASDLSQGTGEIVKKSCPYQVFLFNQEVEETARLFEFNDYEKELLKAVRPPRDYEYKFSVFYMRTPYQDKGSRERGLFYLVPSREFYWTATTHPQDRVKREEYKNFYQSLSKAILALAQEDMEKQ
ncbi:MAG: hypothetical protein QW212_00110 [Nitrososphaerales archaeon]